MSASPALPLTVADVERAVPTSISSITCSIMNLANGESLAAYDSAAKSFKVNALYRQGK